MAITRKPVSKRSDASADKFIGGAKADKVAKAAPVEAGRSPVMVRVPADLLARIDEAAKQRGVSRSAWLLTVASRALDRDDF